MKRVPLITRSASPLTEPPQTPPPDIELTPKAPEGEKEKKQRKEKKQIIDSVTELADGPGARVGRGRNAGLGAAVTKDVSDIVTAHPSLPRSALVMRLLEIREDPLAHFLPTRNTQHGTFFSAAPPGLAPELADMFLRPLANLQPAKRRGGSPDKPPSKKRRVEGEEGEEDEEVGQARRAISRAPSLALGSDVYGPSAAAGMDFTFDEGAAMPIDDFEMKIPEPGREQSAGPLSPLSRLSTPPPDALIEEGEESHADATCPIALFDDRVAGSSQAASQGQSQEPSDDGKGYSKNTVKALSLVRRELQPNPEDEDEDKYMSFNNMAQKVRFQTARLRVRSANVRFSLPIGITQSCGRILLRAARARHARLREAEAGRAVREHRGAREGQALGAPAPRLDGALVYQRLHASVGSPVAAPGLCCTLYCIRLRSLGLCRVPVHVLTLPWYIADSLMTNVYTSINDFWHFLILHLSNPDILSLSPP